MTTMITMMQFNAIIYAIISCNFTLTCYGYLCLIIILMSDDDDDDDDDDDS